MHDRGGAFQLRRPISGLPPGPEARSFARHKQSSGLFVSGLSTSPYGCTAPFLDPSSTGSRRKSPARSPRQ